MTHRLLTALAACLLGTACAPESSLPVPVMALLLNSNGTYSAKEVQLQTLSDTVSLNGTSAEFRGGAQVVVDAEDPLFRTLRGTVTDQQLAEILLKNEGGKPKANYIARNNVLWPADFHTWNLVTAYYAFEQSQAYFQAAYDGANTQELRRPLVLYWPEFIDKQVSSEPEVDNALFYSPLQAFAILPFEKLNKAPLSINLGVIGHEFAHLVFNRRVYDGASWPAPVIAWSSLSPSPSANWLKSWDEGLADFHAFGITCLSETGCNPQFFRQSFDEALVAERDISNGSTCLTDVLQTALQTYSVSEFSGARGLEYRVGTVIASAFYQAAAQTGQLLNLQKSVVSAYDNPSGNGLKQVLEQNLKTPSLFTPEAISDVFLANISNDVLRTQLCSELWNRLQLNCSTMPCDALPHCPINTIKGNSCP